MKVHFIAIGGAAMHNLAIALKNQGHKITGSDDEIFEPSLSRLAQHGLLPEKYGWHPQSLNKEIDLVILGMHARRDNPELKQAKKLKIEVNSYPEFIYNQSRDKKRVVIAGSHGKTTVTSMILHVLKQNGIEFDYLVGANIDGFDAMVKLSDAGLIVLEGDEYFSSPVDMKAKFLWYKPHLALITGIAWDHINVYPTRDEYEEVFEYFIDSLATGGTLFYYDGDPLLKIQAKFARPDIRVIPYDSPEYFIEDKETYINNGNGGIHLKIFGSHNLQNLQGAKMICNAVGVNDDAFYKAITTFAGASNRLQKIAEGNDRRIFKDFAHSPSKLRATITACKEQFDAEKILAVMELHTFSSLNMDFMNEYSGSMDSADNAIVYYNPDTIKHKKLKPVGPEDIKKAFGRRDLMVINDHELLKKSIIELGSQSKVILLMSSGNFSDLDFESLAIKLTGR